MGHHGGLLGTLAEVALPVLGSILLPGAGAALGIPGLVDAAGSATALGGALGGGLGGLGGGLASGGSLSNDLVGAGLGAVGGGIYGDGGLANSLTDVGNSIGGLAGDATLGSDIGSGLSGIGNSIGSGLSQFNQASGLSSLLGGTAEPTPDFQSDFNLYNTPTAGATAAGQASTPALGQTVLGGAGGSPSIASGGATLPSTVGGESIAAPSAFGASNDSQLGFNLAGNPSNNIGSQFSFQGADNALGSAPALSPTTGLAAPTAVGQVSSVPDLQGIITGNPSGGSNMGLLSGLGSPAGGAAPSAGTNVLNGLLRGGLGYLLNNSNTQGANAINSATQAGQALYQPYLQAGNQAEGTLANLYGNNGQSAQTAAQQNFANTPGYQFALNQGLNAVNANAAAMGNPLSGNNEQAINNYAQGAASQNYNNYVNQLQNMASGGANAATGSANLGLTGAGGIAGIGQNNANNQNSAIAQGLNGLFPTGLNLQQLLGQGANNGSGGLLSLLGL